MLTTACTGTLTIEQHSGSLDMHKHLNGFAFTFLADAKSLPQLEVEGQCLPGKSDCVK